MSLPAVESYRPDRLLPPGETLLETIEILGMTRATLAQQAGLPLNVIDEIVAGQAPIDEEIAARLEGVLSVPSRFWMALEADYRDWLARKERSNR